MHKFLIVIPLFGAFVSAVPVSDDGSRRSQEAAAKLNISQVRDMANLYRPDEGKFTQNLVQANTKTAETEIYHPALLRLKRAIEEDRQKNRKLVRHRQANPTRPVQLECSDTSTVIQSLNNGETMTVASITACYYV